MSRIAAEEYGLARFQCAARRQDGSVLLLILGTMALFIFMLVVYLTFQSAFMANDKLQQQAENIVLSASQRLNAEDRAGRMNHLVAAARELVLNSRTAYQEEASLDGGLEPLAKVFLDEARLGAQLVDAERKVMIKSTTNEVTSSLYSSVDQFNHIQFVLPWVKKEPLDISDAQLGYAATDLSNVEAPQGNQNLYIYDRQHSYVDGKTNLYVGHQDLSLPAPDADLHFMMSSLPAAIGRTTVRASLIQDDQFHNDVWLIKNGMPASDTCQFMPSALELTATSQTKSSLNWAQQPLKVVVTAMTNGASPRSATIMDDATGVH